MGTFLVGQVSQLEMATVLVFCMTIELIKEGFQYLL